ncbi:DUF4011 domain-containing protein [Rhodopirellula sp. JC639]|uniref:DUF4011 domain-containing protein n=1 Tax=Stieleria mannarensis TaxID=2755585 RepID=UPI00160266AB|nr:DUF4011 domain-containing protein [Rhodopirellula sp. JC639]
MTPSSTDPASSLDVSDDDLPHTGGAASIEFELSSSVNFASYQNSIPVLRRLCVRNPSQDPLTDLRLELTSEPGFITPKTWVIDRIDPDSTITIDDNDVHLDAGYLDRLNEAQRGDVRFILRDSGAILCRREADLRVLSRDEWGGVSSMGELLSAFVMPNDPAIADVLKQAGEILAGHGLSPSMDGYQSRDPKRAHLLASAIWSAVVAKQLTYANPPKSFESRGQKTRSPSTILRDGLATCLDSSLLFASALEAVGLHPVIVMKHEHCFVGVWLVETCFGQLIERDCCEVRKAVAAGELIVFESTLVTRRPAGSFDDAIQSAAQQIAEAEEDRFVAAIDVQRARMVRIKPLPSVGEQPEDAVDSADTPSAPPLSLPPSGPLPIEESAEPKPTTPEGRIDRWHRKLLDLTLRNRLLNFKATKQTIPFLCPEVSKLEDRLSSGKRLKLVSLPDANVAAGRDVAHHQKTKLEDLEIEYAKAALERNEVCATIGGEELAKRLVTLYRSSRNDLVEGGSNTLYLAVGFLRWKERPSDSRSFRAPLLLVPAKLLRKNANSAYRLAHHEDDVRFNATLIQKLKRDFDCDLSRFESQLPMDNNGVDVPRVLDMVRREIRELPGFEVVDESALASFSFAKYLMWKDLVDRSDQLEQNRVVRHLVRNPETAFQSAVETSIPDQTEMDRRFDPIDLIHPLDADSSQLAAVMAAAEGHDFVLIGPPGTGKSQTIANMIAQCLAGGKTVLFVAEKTAALDVVQRRLEQNGLGDFCVELHSNKAERKRFLRQLDQAWQSGGRKGRTHWKKISEELKLSRDQLNAYVRSLHRQASNGWTAYQAIGVSVAGKSIETPRLSWPDHDQHDRHTYQLMERLADEIALNFGAVADMEPLNAVTRTQWSMQWEQELLEHCEKLCTAIDAFRPELARFCDALGLQMPGDCIDASSSQLRNLHRLAIELAATADDDYQTVFDDQLAELPGHLKDLDDAINAFDSAAAQCAVTFDDDDLKRIPVDQLQRDWNAALESYWPLSYLRKRAVTKSLQRDARLGVADPPNDFEPIRTMQRELAKIDRNPLASRDHLWQHRHTATASVGQHLERCRDLMKLVRRVARPDRNSASQFDSLRQVLKPFLQHRSSDDPLFETAKQFSRSYESLDTAAGHFEHLAGSRACLAKSATCLADSVAMARRIEANRTKLQRWTAWQSVRSRACDVGLTPIIMATELGEVPYQDVPDRFRLAYVRWWLPRVIDSDDVLRDFQRFQHENTIDSFVDLDAKARQAAASRVRKSVAHRLPEQSEVPRKSELGLLRHQIGLKRPSKSIRELVSMMPEHFASLAPCLLMSPLSIAQYLPADQPPFDVVIFDEASQITTWDAIGAIARGRQTIIVGDPNQLPPTNFFGKSNDDEDDEQLEDYERDLESILDEAKASGLPTLQLNWHYRSRHESLIAFSNHHYYDNQLVTFPSPETTDSAVSMRHLPHSQYDRGKTRTNKIEAEAIVAESVARMKQWLELPEQDRKTLGVVTFNSQQQTLIQDLFDQAQRDDPTLEWFFSDDRIEPTVVKNLENVQGDERDLMLFSITFGPGKSGKVPLTFGALNRDGGERRLNVAVTRAREELIVFSSFTADQLPAENSKSRGVRDLKAFLAFAEKGTTEFERIEASSVPSSPLSQDTAGSLPSLESAIADRLRSRGWDVTRQVGVSGFRIALAVRDPSDPNTYLAGIECDGANYRNSATARDRDKTRQWVLENLGWNILRVWSRDWWYDPEGAIERLDEELRDLLAERQ